MALREVPLSELLMQEPEPIVDMMSPLNSVDNSSRDMMVVQEGWSKCRILTCELPKLDMRWQAWLCVCGQYAALMLCCFTMQYSLLANWAPELVLVVEHYHTIQLIRNL